MVKQKPNNLIICLNEDIKTWERQDIEFMEDFPKQAHDIAKEIAAFATSNPATIYLGVGEDRSICGISAIKLEGKTRGKDLIQNRLAGICQKSVKPAIITEVEFIDIDNDIVVVKITIPKGSEPVYYSNNIPYIRNATSSEPATPDQVKGIIRDYYGNQAPVSEDNTDMNILRDILYQLSDFQIIWYDPEKRMINPDLEQMKYDLGATGRNLYNLSTYSYVERLGLSGDLLKLGKALEYMENPPFYLANGKSWEYFIDQGNKAILLNNRLIERVLKNYQLKEEQIPEIKYRIIIGIREIKWSWERRSKIVEQNLIPAQKEIFRRLAFNFNRYANLNLQAIGLDFTLELKTIAQNLREASVHERHYFGQNPLEDIELNIKEALELGRKIISKMSPQLGRDMGLL